jgi:ketosteroid isomerase-like protein
MYRKEITRLALMATLAVAITIGGLLAGYAYAADPAKNMGAVQQMYSDVLTQDFSYFANQVTPDIEWVQPGGPEVPLSGVYKGPKAVTDLLTRMDAMLEIIDFQTNQLVADGNHVVVQGQLQARARPDGQQFGLDFVQMWTLADDGRVSKVELFTDTGKLSRELATGKVAKQ